MFSNKTKRTLTMSKVINLKTNDVKLLLELLFRGRCYTDAYYRDWKKMKNLYEKVVSQLEEQGGSYIGDGEITFR